MGTTSTVVLHTWILPLWASAMREASAHMLAASLLPPCTRRALDGRPPRRQVPALGPIDTDSNRATVSEERGASPKQTDSLPRCCQKRERDWAVCAHGMRACAARPRGRKTDCARSSRRPGNRHASGMHHKPRRLADEQQAYTKRQYAATPNKGCRAHKQVLSLSSLAAR